MWNFGWEYISQFFNCLSDSVIYLLLGHFTFPRCPTSWWTNSNSHGFTKWLPGVWLNTLLISTQYFWAYKNFFCIFVKIRKFTQVRNCQIEVASINHLMDWRIKKGIYICLFVCQITCFWSTYTIIGTMQRRLAWPMRKDDMYICQVFNICL